MTPKTDKALVDVVGVELLVCGLRWHTECAISYGSGAWGLGDSSAPWNGYRDDDAQNGVQDKLAQAEAPLAGLRQ